MSTSTNARRAQVVAARALRAAADRLAPPSGKVEFSIRHPRAHSVHERLHRFPEVSEEESRQLELIDYFGWEIGHKAQACKRWFFGDDAAHPRFLENLGISYWEYAVMHQYALFNRYSPQRQDMFWVYDEILRRLERLGGPQQLPVLDFGCGLGQIGLGFALDGYRVVSADKVPEELAFVRYLFESRGLMPDICQAEGDRDYYDSGADGRRFGCVIEWSVFEHIYDLVECTDAITRGLVPGGIFVTTTLAKDWTPELKEHYIHDSGDEKISDQLFSREIEDYVAEHFDVVSNPRSIAKLLIKK
ncbi:MAG TPA: class I SAM-dependent methyltransferase [Solirubrobacteraceae bacterium]